MSARHPSQDKRCNVQSNFVFWVRVPDSSGNARCHDFEHRVFRFSIGRQARCSPDLPREPVDIVYAEHRNHARSAQFCNHNKGRGFQDVHIFWGFGAYSYGPVQSSVICSNRIESDFRHAVFCCILPSKCDLAYCQYLSRRRKFRIPCSLVVREP